MRTIKVLSGLLIAAGILAALTACGKKAPSDAVENQGSDNDASWPATEAMEIASFPDLGEYELHEPARYQDGIIRFQYDGNTILPVSVSDTYGGVFHELTLTYADLREWGRTDTYGYIYYGTEAYEQDLDAVVGQEEVYFLPGSPTGDDGIEKTPYGEKTDDYIGYLYHYQADTGAYLYNLLVIRNLEGADGLAGSAIVRVQSDDMSVILAAKQMADTIEIVGTLMDDTLSEESLSRTDRIYELLCPEQAAAIQNPAEVEGGSIFEAFSIENLENQNADKAEWAIWFEKPTYVLAPGEKVTPVLIGPGKDEKIEYRISNEDVATVNAKGEVTGISDGFVMLVATNEHGATCNTYCDVLVPEGGGE